MIGGHTSWSPGARFAGGVLALASAVTLVLAAGYWLVGRRLLTALLTGKAQSLVDERTLRWRLDETYAKLPDLMFIKLIVLVWILAAIALVVATPAVRSKFGAVAGRVGLSLLSLFVVYYSVESFAAPFLIERLDLFYFYSVLDVDHRLPRSDPDIPTNADGIRSTRESHEFHPDGTNIVFLGDSYTFGQYVGVEEAFPMRVEALLAEGNHQYPIRVANFGWVSASPFLSARLLEDAGDRYSPDVVVMCVDMTDFFEEILYRAMVQRRGLYRLYDKMPITLNLLRTRAPGIFWGLYDRINHFIPDKRFFVTEAPLAETREQMGPLVRSLESIHEQSERIGADFVVFLLPRSFQYSAEECPDNIEKDLYTVLGPHSPEPFRFFEEIKDDLDFPVISLLETFQETTVFPTCFNNDPHWNPAGHEVAAQAIAEHLSTRIPGTPNTP